MEQGGTPEPVVAACPLVRSEAERSNSGFAGARDSWERGDSAAVGKQVTKTKAMKASCLLEEASGWTWDEPEPR